jgi:hypothetical protein
MRGLSGGTTAQNLYLHCSERSTKAKGGSGGAVALNNAPKPAPQPNEQADKTEDNEELPHQGQN